jgi:predicted nucleic acid-binding Zn ribbon protein
MMNNLLINNKSVCIREKSLKLHNFELYNKIIKFNKNLHTTTWTHKVYNFINNIIKSPKCPVCGKNVKFHRFSIGYSRCCSNKCHLISKETQENRRKTNLKNFGVGNVFQSNKIKEKSKQTLIKKYGVENSQQSNKIKEKSKQTLIKKYGVENYSQTKEFLEKSKNTWLNKYGVDSPIKNAKIKKKIKNSINNNYRKKWSKILNISLNDIIILDDNIVIIKNFCKKHIKFKISKHNIKNRTLRSDDIKYICTKCYNISKQSSIKENEVYDFINNELNIKNIIKKDKNILNGLEIDIYLPDYKLGIEFDGIYYHSNKFKDKNYHLNKTNLCEQQGIELFHIFEDEWLYKKEIVKSIIKNKLNIIENIILVNECTIKEIDSPTCSNFLNDNHIQGVIKSKIKIGLFYNSELVLVMTFSKKRINDEYEMHRFCNKLNTQVIGGASKLLSYFIKTYNPKSILTFADRRYSNGGLYKQLGFKFIENIKPNYWYIKKHELIKYRKYNFRKDKLISKEFDKNKTKNEIMLERGYLKIYDCGKIKFEKLFDNNN